MSGYKQAARGQARAVDGAITLGVMCVTMVAGGSNGGIYQSFVARCALLIQSKQCNNTVDAYRQAGLNLVVIMRENIDMFMRAHKRWRRALVVSCGEGRRIWRNACAARMWRQSGGISCAAEPYNGMKRKTWVRSRGGRREEDGNLVAAGCGET